MAAAQLRATDYLLWTAALAWPFGVFLQTPVAGVDLLMVIAMLLLCLLVPDAMAARRLRVPFEIWAPALLLAIFAIAQKQLEPAPRSSDILGGLLLLVLVVQANPTRQRIHHYMFAGAISAGVAALISWATPWLGLLPTAFSLQSDANFTFAYTLADGTYTLLLGAVFALHAAICADAVKWQRAVATISFLVISALLADRLLEWWRDTHSLPAFAYPPMHWSVWVSLALALWLVVRVVAKVAIDRRNAGDSLHWMWGVAATITLAVVALTPLDPHPYHGFLLGLACATALPQRVTVQSTRWPLVGALVVAAFVVINLFVVFPVNVRDPRQYDAAAEREMPRIFDHMDWVDRYARNERRTYLWRARAALELGMPNFSSFAYERAARPLSGTSVLAGPTESERQQFLVQMRDLAAALPEDRAVCAYERVLLANGERDGALYSLRLRTGVPLIHVEDSDAAPYTRVAALVIGDPGLAEELRTWTADEVLTLLSLWGTDVAFAANPNEAPNGLFILGAQRTWDTFHVHVRVGEQVSDFSAPLAPITQRDVESLMNTSVMVWAGPGDGASGNTRYTLNVLTTDAVLPAAYVDVHADGAAEFSWAENPPAIAFTPAVRVRIAK